MTHQVLLSMTTQPNKQQETNEYMKDICDTIENGKLYVHNLIPHVEDPTKNILRILRFYLEF